MPRLPRHPAPWFSALLLWLGTLWFASSTSGMGPGLPIPHLDKAAHFSYFFAGGFLFAGCHLRLLHERPDWRKIITAAIIAMAVIGWLDEWHQTFTAGRQGGDPWDWLADLLGGTAGAVALKGAHRRMK